MQRLGFLKYLVLRASQKPTNDLSSLGNDLINSLSRKVNVNLNINLKEYIGKSLQEPKYKIFKKEILIYSDEQLLEQKRDVELQDYLLSDERIVSKKGRLVKEDWRRYPHFAIYLGFLRKQTFSINSEGQAFLCLISDEEKKTLLNNLIEYKEFLNPLIINDLQKIYLLYSFIKNDGDVLTKLYPQLLNLGDIFTERDVGDLLPDIYRNIATKLKKTIKSGDDIIKINKLLDTANTIESWKKRPYKSGGARDQAALLRLEPFVDLGLISKPDPYSYKYSVNKNTITSIGFLNKVEDIQLFLNDSFFSMSIQLFTDKKNKSLSETAFIKKLEKAYELLKSTLGYVSINELSLLVGCFLLVEENMVSEVNNTIRKLKEYQKDFDSEIRFNIDKWGNLSYIKFVNFFNKF